MLIKNKTSLTIIDIANIIAFIQEKNYADTQYVGKIEVSVIGYKDKQYKVQTRILKRYVEWIIKESE